MGSQFLRHSFGPFASSSRSRGLRFASPRFSSLLLGVTVAAGALLVVPQTPRAWAAPTVGGDENGPKVQILSPAYQDVLKGRARILVGVKATQFNPSTIQLFLDDAPASNILSLSSFASSSFDWDTTKVSDGPHKLSVRVTDTQGFRGWAEVSVYINNQNVRDTVAPELSWDNVQQFQQLSGTARIQLQAKDNFGVKWIIVSLNPIAKGLKQPADRSWILSTPPYALNLDTTRVADGLYALSARVWDHQEQEGSSQMLTVGVVNSPVNATTVGETLDALRAKDKAERTAVPAPPKPKPVVVNPPAPRKADAYSGGVIKPPSTTNGTRKPPTVVTPRVTVPKGGTRVEVAQNPTQNTATPPVPNEQPSTNLTQTTRNATSLGQISPPDDTERSAQTATLSLPDSADVLDPARSTQTATGDAKANDPVFVAKLDAPEMEPRTDVVAPAATLSTVQSNDHSALAPARSPEFSVPATKERVEIARLAVPEGEARELDVAPVLSASKSQFSGAISGARTVRGVVNSAPGTKIRPSGMAKVSTRPVYQREPHKVVKVVDTTATVKPPVAQTPEVAPMSAPQLSQPKVQNDGVVATRRTPSPLSKIGPRVAARPRADDNPVEVTPDTSTVVRPAITVSPIQTAFNTKLPAFYQARHNTTLRAIAHHFKLPVELVAAENNWTTDMHVLSGMKVQLPRQVQLSYNGQKVRGDVASLMAGDTTFTAMRFLFEHTGGTVTWDAKKQEVVAHKGASTIRIKIGSKSASVNNKQVMMQLAAFLFEGRTMVPARFFEEGLNAQVQWNPETGHLVVAMAG